MTFATVADLITYINSIIYINTVGEIEADKMNNILLGICSFLATTASATFFLAQFQIGVTGGAPTAEQTTYQNDGLKGRTILVFARDGLLQRTVGSNPYSFDATGGTVTTNAQTPWADQEEILIIAV